MKYQNVRETLIERTVTVIANLGLDRATTKAIVGDTGINEAYIYRQFADKDDMIVKAFDMLDEELVAVVLKNITVMEKTELEFETRCRLYFSAVWQFLLSNRDKCLAFVQYFYSLYFSRFSADDHKARFQPVIEKFSVVFRDEADVWMILNHILNVMLDFAVKVHNDQMSKDDDYAEHVFRVIYASVEQYFR